MSAVTTEVDLAFLFLRIITLAGGFAWLFVEPLTASEKGVFVQALTCFFVYSVTCYIVIFFQPGRLKNVYYVSLFLDIVFLSTLVYLEPHFEKSFFLGFYLLVCLHTIYFGLRFGLVVSSFCAFFYLISVSPLFSQIQWTDLALRVVFFYLIAVPVGLLSEKVKREKETVENLNMKLADSLKNLKLIQGKLIESEKFSALGRLTADIAHEIRNPLTAVGGFARRLDKQIEKGSKEKEYISIIIQEVTRLENILVDTLVYGKAARFKLEREYLAKPISAAVGLFREMCREQNISLVENLDKNLPRAQIDSAQVQQTIESLISNSMDAMPDGGVIDIKTGKEEKNDALYLTVSVNDSGIGIPGEISSYIFEPFYSTKKIGLGTGLGLPIVRKIMEEHRGFVSMRNNHDKGATVTLYFPHQTEEEANMLPCWEYLGCGIETDPARSCPAYPYFGRICWATAGTDCAGKAEGICAAKIGNCKECSFYKMINKFLPIYSGKHRKT